MQNIFTSSVAAGVLAMGFTCSACFAAGFPPYFNERTPETVIVDLNAGQNSFESTGTAIDLDPFDTVYISTAPLPSFITLDVMNGNPATFRLHGENLTGADYGGYFVDLIASDSPNNIFNATSISFAIGIIPEPGSASLVFISSLAVLSRRRHVHH